VRDKQKALEKSSEWGEKIPIGVFYKEERPTYRDSLPHVKDVPLTKLPIDDVDIDQILSRMK
jgi:2-oxoglutarate ferredoxin oxidoreductase subunit beta